MEQKSLGGYTILGELGRDTAGAVFRATDAQGDREVAIRTLPPTLPRDLRDRFLNEARAARRLKHANIVSVLEVGQHLDTAYIVMELIDGHALQQVMRASVRITLDRAAELAAQIADGLDCAHRVPIIHGNLKPANVPVEGGGRAKLTDFGVASLATPVTPKPVRPFQSPEQAGDQPLDARSDIFSLGVMLYAMLVRKAPFHRGLGEAHRPIREVDPNVPEAPEKIVDKALARNPDGHYLRATELAAELRKWRAHAKVTPTPSPLASVDILGELDAFSKKFDAEVQEHARKLESETPANEETRRLAETATQAAAQAAAASAAPAAAPTAAQSAALAPAPAAAQPAAKSDAPAAAQPAPRPAARPAASPVAQPAAPSPARAVTQPAAPQPVKVDVKATVQPPARPAVPPPIPAAVPAPAKPAAPTDDQRKPEAVSAAAPPPRKKMHSTWCEAYRLPRPPKIPP